MEMDKSYASKGVAGTGLGLGIAGTALELWSLEHSYYVNKYATVKAILDLYSK